MLAQCFNQTMCFLSSFLSDVHAAPAAADHPMIKDMESMFLINALVYYHIIVGLQDDFFPCLYFIKPPRLINTDERLTFPADCVK
jgi:hypothetical protein